MRGGEVDRAQRVGPHPHGVESLFDGRPYASVIVSCMMMDIPLDMPDMGTRTVCDNIDCALCLEVCIVVVVVSLRFMKPKPSCSLPRASRTPLLTIAQTPIPTRRKPTSMEE